MISKRRLHDKYVSWRKLFATNWALFKASRIGLVGLGIMIAFLVVAAAAPFMGLRDPLYWLAPESDTIQFKQYWQQEVKPGGVLQGANGSVNQTIAFRVWPQGQDAKTDRIYVAEGYRLYAFNARTSIPAWIEPFVTTDHTRISADPLIVNVGSYVSPAEAQMYLIVGSQSGDVYVMNDTSQSSTLVPFALVRNLNSTITSLAAYSDDQLPGTNDKDMFVAGTADGDVYAFTFSRTDNASGRTFYHELWKFNVGVRSPIHMAGTMIRTTESTPKASPAFYTSSVIAALNGEAVYLGTGDGRVFSLWARNGTERWPAVRFVSPYLGSQWTSSPFVLPAAEVRPSTPTLVYMAGRDYDATEGNVTRVWVLYADNGTVFAPWDDQVPGGKIPIVYKGVAESGYPTTPAVYGPAIFVTTDSGYLYRIQRDAVRGLNNEITFPAGQVMWAYRDNSFPHDATHATYFDSSPYFFRDITYVIVGGSYNNGTASRADDIGIVYVFNQAQATDTASPIWRLTFASGIHSTPIAWKDYLGDLSGHTYPSLYFATYRGDVYSYSTTGQYLAPLPPSWARSTPYPSGNYYILGTDARGRDIFSQLLWGSRIALVVGFASAAFSIAIGVIVGLVAGFLGGRVESLLMRFTDVILVIPALPLVIIMAAVLGAGIGNIILVIAIVGWPGVARVIRSEVLSLKERPFIDSARVTGASNVRIMFRHIAPNVAPLAFLYMTFAVSGAILTEAALSFIGLGDINTISWGIMLQDVSQSKALEAWWWLLPPGMAITLISLSFFLVGRAFDEIVNPRLRKR